MPVHKNTQGSGFETADPQLAPAQVARVMLPMVVAQSLRLNEENTWQFNDHDGAGWQDCPDQLGFIPDIRVRKMTLCDATTQFHKVTYDLPGNGSTRNLSNNNTYQVGVTEVLQSNVSWGRHITKIYLDGSLTDATMIVLLG